MQRVVAIGEPPEGCFCAFRGLVNVVVLPSVGKFVPLENPNFFFFTLFILQAPDPLLLALAEGTLTGKRLVFFATTQGC